MIKKTFKQFKYYFIVAFVFGVSMLAFAFTYNPIVKAEEEETIAKDYYLHINYFTGYFSGGAYYGDLRLPNAIKLNIDPSLIDSSNSYMYFRWCNFYQFKDINMIDFTYSYESTLSPFSDLSYFKPYAGFINGYYYQPYFTMQFGVGSQSRTVSNDFDFSSIYLYEIESNCDLEYSTTKTSWNINLTFRFKDSNDNYCNISCVLNSTTSYCQFKLLNPYTNSSIDRFNEFREVHDVVTWGNPIMLNDVKSITPYNCDSLNFLGEPISLSSNDRLDYVYGNASLAVDTIDISTNVNFDYLGIELEFNKGYVYNNSTPIFAIGEYISYNTVFYFVNGTNVIFSASADNDRGAILIDSTYDGSLITKMYWITSNADDGTRLRCSFNYSGDFEYYISLGFDRGYEVGQRELLTDANNPIYQAIFRAGYSEGSLNENNFLALVSAPIDSLVVTFRSLFNFTFLGFNMLSVMEFLLTISLVCLIVKMISGWYR